MEEESRVLAVTQSREEIEAALQAELEQIKKLEAKESELKHLREQKGFKKEDLAAAMVAAGCGDAVEELVGAKTVLTRKKLEAQLRRMRTGVLNQMLWQTPNGDENDVFA